MTYYYGINKGDGEYSSATSSSSTTSKDVEVVVNNTNVTTRQELISSLEKLINVVLRSNWPL